MEDDCDGTYWVVLGCVVLVLATAWNILLRWLCLSVSLDIGTPRMWTSLDIVLKTV